MGFKGHGTGETVGWGLRPAGVRGHRTRGTMWWGFRGSVQKLGCRDCYGVYGRCYVSEAKEQGFTKVSTFCHMSRTLKNVVKIFDR